MRRLGRDRDFRASESATVVEGWTLVDEALRSGLEPEELFVEAGERARLSERRLKVRASEVSRSIMESVSALETPPGVLAVFRTPFRRPGGAPALRVLVLADLADPGNVGTLMRSAEAAGFDLVVLAGTAVDVHGPKVIRASAGAAFRVTSTTVADLEWLREAGRGLVAEGTTFLGLTSASAVSGGNVQSIYEVPLSGPVAVVVGSESHGLPKTAPVDLWVTIPHHGPTESLNAAMAGTVACMHVAERLASNEKRRADDRE